MQAPKSLRKPLNWQDFETLCKKLWGEIWKCSEIKKNGRSGQLQHGVDIYGIPTSEKQCYGIQCKGKDEYSNKQFTVQEIEAEIEKAKEFKPALKKLYFATTANKDVVIEEFVRIKNLEHLENDLFEVHLFCWEDIVDLIDENPETYRFYIESQNFRDSKSVDVVFHNGEHEVTLKPKFKQHKTAYRKDYMKNLSPGLANMNHVFSSPMFDMVQRASINARVIRSTVNLSYAEFNIVVRNTGTESLEDYQLTFQLIGDIEDLTKTNVKNDFPTLINPINYKPTTFVEPKSKSGKLIPNHNKLVGDNIFESADIFIKTPPKNGQITIQWKLIANNFKTYGELTIKVEPEIKSIFKEIIVDEKSEERIELGGFEDFIESKD
ncbi:MAG: hypothetical protein EOO90_06490 [Pedobacter sp.]|nr:MAG: hypothetical protein EOO90_06490 [Pedobacter sp.]